MAVSELLLPVFVQVGLTFFLMFWMGILRRRALSSGAVKPGDIALRQPNWPPRALQVANAFHNQLASGAIHLQHPRSRAAIIASLNFHCVIHSNMHFTPPRWPG